MLRACNLGCGLLFSLSSAWGLFLECFRFVRCGALGHVVTSAFSLCGVVACVFLRFLICLGKRVVIFTFLERVVNILWLFFLFVYFSEWSYSTSRPGGNQVDGLPPV